MCYQKLKIGGLHLIEGWMIRWESRTLATPVPSRKATLAQLVERLIRNFYVWGYAIDSTVGYRVVPSVHSASRALIESDFESNFLTSRLCPPGTDRQTHSRTACGSRAITVRKARAERNRNQLRTRAAGPTLGPFTKHDIEPPREVLGTPRELSFGMRSTTRQK